MRAAALRRGARSMGVFLEMVKVSHSIFALPFAVSALFLASGGFPSLPVLGKVVLAVVFARTAALAFNRWADADIDALNPRTRSRAIPAALLSRPQVGIAALLSGAVFVLTAAWINRLAFALSPVVLVVLLGYSYTKRFTRLSHLVLGLALGLSPLGAWVAARGEVALLPAVLGAAVLFWTAGFDIIYACQDVDFDRKEGLRSIPERWGVARALAAARILHAFTVALLIGVGYLGGLDWVYGAGVAVVALLLIYEHSLVRPEDLSRVNQAFFTVNGIVSLAYMAAVIGQTLLA